VNLPGFEEAVSGGHKDATMHVGGHGPESEVAPYLQLAAILRGQIERGELPPAVHLAAGQSASIIVTDTGKAPLAISARLASVGKVTGKCTTTDWHLVALADAGVRDLAVLQRGVHRADVPFYDVGDFARRGEQPVAERLRRRGVPQPVDHDGCPSLASQFPGDGGLPSPAS